MTDDDYHLYEMNVADRSLRQLTFGQGVADIEPAYLAGGDIIFNSSRCQQIVDCWWADVSNLYTCDGDGRFLRRLSFDQVHTNYPQVLSDGRVIYTRWDYNDRGQLFPQPLFEMNPDGTAQRGYYGNSSWFPTTILHARGIPGTQKLVCVLSGHHTYQKGKLAIIDPAKGREENLGTQLIAPIRPTEAVKIDKYGYEGEQFQYPYALSETEFLVTYSTEGSLKGRGPSERPFGIYFMTIDGRRELLTASPKISSNQSVPLVPRPEPRVRPSLVDYRKATGTYVVHDVYAGAGVGGYRSGGTIKRLRVVALEFRAAGVGRNSNRGPAGGAMVSTPISINGAWDVKRVLGTTPVYEDGSAAFRGAGPHASLLPGLGRKGPRRPIDAKLVDPSAGRDLLLRRLSRAQEHHLPRQPPQPWPCVPAPNRWSPSAIRTRATASPSASSQFSTSTASTAIAAKPWPKAPARSASKPSATLDEKAEKVWSDAYKALADPQYTSWVSPQSAPPQFPPYSAGAARSKLIELLDAGHEDVALSPAELAELACWIDLAVPFAGTYTEGMPDEQAAKYAFYLNKRRQSAADDERNIESLLEAQGN